MELISNPLVFFGSMLRKYTSYLALIPLVFGICLAFNPYLFVPEYVVERYRAPKVNFSNLKVNKKGYIIYIAQMY